MYSSRKKNSKTKAIKSIAETMINIEDYRKEPIIQAELISRPRYSVRLGLLMMKINELAACLFYV